MRSEKANAPPSPFFEGAGHACFPFSSPSHEGMERREAPGRWCYAALWRVWCDPPRAYGHSRLPGVTACEARAPIDGGGCASRRSTITDARFLPASALEGLEATSGLASSAPPRHERGRELSKAGDDYY